LTFHAVCAMEQDVVFTVGSGLFHCCLWQETLFGSLPVLSALPSEEEDLRGLDRSGNVALIVKVRFAGDAGEW